MVGSSARAKESSLLYPQKKLSAQGFSASLKHGATNHREARTGVEQKAVRRAADLQFDARESAGRRDRRLDLDAPRLRAAGLGHSLGPC
jgi:hypothetical protein